MMFIDGEGVMLAILLLMVAGFAFFIISIAQIARGIFLSGWRGLLYPLQLGLTILSAAIGWRIEWLIPVFIIAATALGYITRREDPDLGWFAILSMMITWGVCIVTYLTL